MIILPAYAVPVILRGLAVSKARGFSIHPGGYLLLLLLARLHPLVNGKLLTHCQSCHDKRVTV